VSPTRSTTGFSTACARTDSGLIAHTVTSAPTAHIVEADRIIPRLYGYAVRMNIRLCAVVAGILTSSASVSAQDVPRLTRIADHVFTYEHADPTKRGVTVNNLVVVTTDGVLVADGQGTPENTRQLVEAIRSVTPQPIRYVVVGSIHGDHRGGDAAFPSTAEFIKAARTLTLGGEEIQILFLGRAHTGSDLEVFLSRERVMFMSESFSNDIFPSMANGFPSEWIAVLDTAQRMDVVTYVPAHALMTSPRLATTKADVRRYQQALRVVFDEGKRLHDAGVSVDDAPAKAKFGEAGSWFRMQENAPGALKRVYLELNHELPEKSQ